MKRKSPGKQPSFWPGGLKSVWIIAPFFIGCQRPSSSSKDTAPTQRTLSAVEREAILPSSQAPSSTVDLVVTHPGASLLNELKNTQDDGEVQILSTSTDLVTVRIPVQNVDEFQEKVLESSPTAHVVWNGPVGISAEEKEALELNDQLLFSGKEEFGLQEWRSQFPEADGRGIRIGVVDDGVALFRPGLQTTSQGLPKIVSIAHPTAQRQVPLVFEPKSCGKSPAQADLEKLTLTDPKWATAVTGRAFGFYLNSCNINPYLESSDSSCPDWSSWVFSKGQSKAVVGVYEVSTSSQAPKSYLIGVDINQDGQLSGAEIMQPLSQSTTSGDLGLPTQWQAKEGLGFAFDIHPKDSSLFAPQHAFEKWNPCLASESFDHVLTLSPPQKGEVGGSHGEGVAAIAAGHKIAGKNIDGMAPGAQLVDIPFNNDLGAGRYTIGEVARALKVAGDRSHIVNLSYSLFFHNGASQVAMGRLLDSLLGATPALYFFSAGNNGPGIGTMNRGLIYPRLGLSVAAFLNGRMAQSTFGSALPWEGVVTYSSRGPGLDGATSAQILSPLAGIVPSTADKGFGPFSGTSSATPAMSGFAARLSSAILSQGLKWDRDLLRTAILNSAKPLPGVSRIDQGAGIPQLIPAWETYQSLLKSTKAEPQILVNLPGHEPRGVQAKGIYVRGTVGKQAQYTVQLSTSFSSAWDEASRGEYAVSARLESDASYLKFPEALLLNRSAQSFFVSVDWDNLLAPGRFPLGTVLSTEIKITDSSSRSGQPTVLARVPVTIVIPAPSSKLEFNVTAPANQLARIFVTRPAQLDKAQLLYSVETKDPENRLCGVHMVIAPSGEKIHSASFNSTPVRAEKALATPWEGVYEITLANHLFHQSCPTNQTYRVKLRWVQVEVEALEWIPGSEAKGNLKLALQSPSHLSGQLKFPSYFQKTLLPLQKNVSHTSYDWESRTSFLWTGGSRLTLALPQPQASHLAPGYLALNVEAYSQGSLLSSLSLPNSGIEVDLPGSAEADQLLSHFRVFSFDQGLTTSFPLTIPYLEARLFPKSYRDPVNAVAVQLPAQQSITQVISLDKAGESWEGSYLQCVFVPDGFVSGVPCGDLAVP